MRGKASCFYTHIHATDNTLTHVHTYTYTHTVFEMLAQYQMIWMLLSMTVGWTHTLSTAQPKKEKTRDVWILYKLLLCCMWTTTNPEALHDVHGQTTCHQCSFSFLSFHSSLLLLSPLPSFLPPPLLPLSSSFLPFSSPFLPTHPPPSLLPLLSLCLLSPLSLPSL